MKLREYYSLLPFGYLRIQKLVTRVLGLKYQRSRKFIEIDIPMLVTLNATIVTAPAARRLLRSE
ncbi:hypothetical protein CEE44_05475 [Candidatus Woesearchaeota archaeon B3_Woes]|nr:MAG: hypothetical protein E3J77_05440 [Actinomycetota bacterium]TKJ16538.1 MAG: hypothetical protein CEE44_05475 [Candidatus Woesearchaeota archaeon B3_Woes]